MTATTRIASLERSTRETQITVSVNLDGTGESDIKTGIGFLDHMLTALSRHSGIDIQLTCTGDLDVDGHHTSEDCALVLGQAIDEALGTKRGITRFGYAYAPLDEALARCVVDLSGRPWPEVNLDLRRERIGTMATENITHVFESLAISLRANVHVDLIRGKNDHHRAEAAFKACAMALKASISLTGRDDVPSTKGVLA